MTARSDMSDATAMVPPRLRGRLFRKYVALFVTVVSAALVINGLFDIWFSYRDQNNFLIALQRGQAESAASRIGQFIKEIEGQMARATQLPWSVETIDEWRYDTVRLLRQVPAITEVSQLDASGHEQARMSRLAMDVIGSRADHSTDPAFIGAVENKTYYGPVYFLRESEPYMTIAMAGVRREYGAIVVQVNLKFMWDVISAIKVGTRGLAYVVGPQGRLIAHPDISLVLRNTDLSQLAQVSAARTDLAPEPQRLAHDIEGHAVLSAYAPIAPLGWLVFVERPLEEAYAPLYASIRRSAAILVGALVLAAFAGLFLARRMIVPIRMLRDGAARIGGGDLTQRITIETGDELEALGDQFNSMAAQLQDSYATLERKVEERTNQLELANLAKSRFLAAASHDLRQPLHALGLFVAQLHDVHSPTELKSVVARIEEAVAAMNELFNVLLDISKLDAGVLAPNLTEFPVAELLARTETTFAGAASENGLSLRVIPSGAWVRSDFILLERILLNLVSNAVRYTTRGGIVVGCRRRGDRLRIEVWDTGPGIPADQHHKIFSEFYRMNDPETDRKPGLGLGLAIVERLCRLLDHPIELASRVGRGSRFTVAATLIPARFKVKPAEPTTAERMGFDVAIGKFVVVIDDDPLVLDGMGGLLRGWGCEVVCGRSARAALSSAAPYARTPDLIISDYTLAMGETGLEAIAALRATFKTPIPAVLLSGDTSPERFHEARASGYRLLHKPVDPMTLRAIINKLLKVNGTTIADG